MIELVNIGALETPEFEQLFGELYGVPELTKEQKDTIIKQGKKIQKIKAADVRHKEEQKLMAYILELGGLDVGEIMTSFWYAHVLSGAATHVRNISDAYVSSYIEPLHLAGFNVTDIRRMIRAHRRGMKMEGRQRFMETMTTGYTPLAKKLEIPSALERIQAEPTSDKRSAKIIAYVMNLYKDIFKYVPRLLSATDAYIYAGAKEAYADILTSKRARKQLEAEKGRKLTRAEKKTLQSKLDEYMHIDKAEVARIKQEVDNESDEYKKTQEQFGEEPTGYNQREKNLRVFEIIDQERGLDISDDAFDLAGRAIGNIKTHGNLGRLVDGASQWLRKIQFEIPKPEIVMKNGKPIITFNQTKTMKIAPLALVIPFTRIVANVATRNLGWNMYVGATRAMTGKFGLGLSKDNPYHMEMTPEEKKSAWQKVLKVGIIHSLLYFMTQPDDDGESFINIP